MAQDDNRNWMWFAAGASLGAGIALMLAPSSGEETRRYLASKAEGSGREFLDMSRDLFERGRQLADEAAEVLEDGRKLVEG
jgi:gas vesicle protein